jgi:hypothetical protein
MQSVWSGSYAEQMADDRELLLEAAKVIHVLGKIEAFNLIRMGAGVRK